MKKLLTLTVLLFSFLLTFAQSSEYWTNERNEKIKQVEKEYAPKNGVTNNPKMKEQKLASIDSTYLPRISEAEAREQNYQSQSTNTQQTTQNPPRRNGGTITFEGRKGSFSGGSYSITKTANAFAIAVSAEAEAYFKEKMADNFCNNTESQNNNKVLLVNENYKAVTFIIKMIGSEFKIEETLMGKSVLEINLPAGKYNVSTIIHISGRTESTPVIKEAGNPMTYGSYNGKQYSFVSIFRGY